MGRKFQKLNHTKKDNLLSSSEDINSTVLVRYLGIINQRSITQQQVESHLNSMGYPIRKTVYSRTNGNFRLFNAILENEQSQSMFFSK